ncbi:transcription factor c6 [Diplodia corticola]|uniref:Transcription factor c6 n=1 Tax=Diplodia corticola TaxID=236234 RepID=A0A1J9RCU0_9PEZI|nr:transcription factor c6 [Diplodia corticola]OJD37922.1 transcription factor c6 [Diplodia corticola]
MYRSRRRILSWPALLLSAAVQAAAAAPSNASGASGPLSPVSSAAALTTPGPDLVSSTAAFTWTGTESSLVRQVHSCESAKRAWYTASSDWYWSSHASYSYSSTTTYDTLWLSNYTGPLSTFCDGVPRASGPAPTTTTIGQVYVNSIPPPFPSPSPTCTFDYHGCELVVSSYRSWYATSHPATVNPPLPPLCEWGPNECIIPAGEEECRLDAGDVKLIFWPQSKDPSQLCATNNGVPKTAAPTPATPVIATSGDYTFTSPSVYLSFKQLQGLPCYKTWTSAIVPVPSTDISSLVFGQTNPIERTTSINWADMNSPVPLSAYKGQQSCWDNWLGVRGTAAGGDGCATVYDDYLPWLALPTNPAHFTAIDPLFANCTSLFWRKYVFDPPYYLTPVGDLLPPTPTATADAKTTATTDDDISAAQQQQPTASAAALTTTLLPAKTTITAPRFGGGGAIATLTPPSSNTNPSDPSSNTNPSDPSDPNPNNPTNPADPITISADPANPNAILINHATLLPGQDSTIGTTPILVRTGAVVIGDQTTVALPLAATDTAPRPIATVADGRLVVAADGEGNFVLPGGRTLSVGEGPVVVEGVTVEVSVVAAATGAAATGGAEGAGEGGQVLVVEGGGAETVTVSAGETGGGGGGGGGGDDGGTGAVVSVGTRVITAQEVGEDGVLVVGGTRTISAGGPAASLADGVVVSAVAVGTDGSEAVVVVGDGTTSTARVSSLLSKTRTTSKSSGLDATTSVPGLGWAGATTAAAATASTKSEAAAPAAALKGSAGEFWLSVLGGVALVVVAMAG